MGENHNDKSSFENEYILRQHKTCCECYRDSNNAAIAFSKSALNSALWLNGMGAVAVLYSPQVKIAVLTDLLAYFAFGALLACIAIGSAYVVQYYISKTWESFLYQSPKYKMENAWLPKINMKLTCLLRILTIAIIVTSYAMFILGVTSGYKNLSKGDSQAKQHDKTAILQMEKQQ